MKFSSLRLVSAAVGFGLVVASGMAQDPTGKHHGGGGGGGGNSGGSSSSGGNSGGGSKSGGSGGSGSHVESPPQKSGGGDRGGDRGDRGGNRGGNSGGTDNGGSRSGGSGSPRSGGGGGNRTDDNGNQGGSRRVTITDPSGRNGNRGQSRSGEVHYGTNTNVLSKGRVDPTPIRRPTSVIFRGTSIDRRVNQQERIGLNTGGWRTGYYHYDRRWRDDWFFYPHYVFNPYAYETCYTSPWYYYPSCPPYIDSTRVIIVSGGVYSSWNGNPYRWNRPSNDRWGDYSDLDYTIDDIVSAFQDDNQRAINRLVPRNGNVAIYMDGRYDYSLNSDDFYDLYQDGIENVRTQHYEVIDSRFDGNNHARVVARQDFTDPWGKQTTIYHIYFLERERNKFVIREFGTSVNRP